MNTQSLVEPITKQIELQSQPPFLLYRNERSAISGFWFYCKDDCVRVHSLLEKLIKKCNNSNARPADNNNKSNHHPVQPQQQQQQAFVKSQNHGQNGKQDVDIFSMLSKAQQDFNNSGASVSDKLMGEQQQLQQNFAGMQLRLIHPPPPQQQPQPNQQQLVRQLSTAMPDITSPNVVNFFAAAQPRAQPNGVGPNKNDRQSQNNQFIGNHPNAPPVQTLDEIEKQHRVSSSPPQQQQKAGKFT